MSPFQIDPQKRPLFLVGSIIAILVGLIFIFATQCERGFRPKLDEVGTQLSTVVAQVTAEETAKLLDHKGEIVLVVMDIKQPGSVFEAQTKAFQEALKKQGGITVVATETVPFGQKGMAVPADVFFKILEKHPNASAIVSFAGLPVLKDEDVSNLGQNLPRLVAFSSGGMGVKKLFEQQIARVVIMPRIQGVEHDETPVPKKKSETDREWFERYYQVVTPETAPSLPY